MGQIYSKEPYPTQDAELRAVVGAVDDEVGEDGGGDPGVGREIEQSKLEVDEVVDGGSEVAQGLQPEGDLEEEGSHQEESKEKGCWEVMEENQRLQSPIDSLGHLVAKPPHEPS